MRPVVVEAALGSPRSQHPSTFMPEEVQLNHIHTHGSTSHCILLALFRPPSKNRSRPLAAEAVSSLDRAQPQFSTFSRVQRPLQCSLYCSVIYEHTDVALVIVVECLRSVPSIPIHSNDD